jgi:N-sulfoglucosamine sulfohydrolase
MKRLFALLAGLVLGVAASPRPAAPADPKLNLLLITADDMNADSSGWMGSRLKCTPNLDAFAATAHRFVNQHVTVPICQPGRQALLTGRVPHRNGGLGFNPIRDDVPTLVEVLKGAGYCTAGINKLEHMAPAPKFPWDHRFSASGKNPRLLRSQVEEALKEAAAAGKPFFINANITDPHRPFYGSAQGMRPRPRRQPMQEGEVEPFTAEQVDTPSFLEDLPPVRQEVAEYYTSVRRFDVSFGGVIDALKASGAADRTLVVFMSDHGMSFPFSKASVYRNGSWSPLIVRWPGMGTPQVRQELVSSVDVMPSLLELLKVVPPAGMDGRSWLSLLRGEKQPDRDHVVTHVNSVSSGMEFPQRCIRTKAHSLLFQPWAGSRRFRVEAMAGLTYNALAAAGAANPRIQARVDQYIQGRSLAMYDLAKDPDERLDVLGDPTYRAEADRLKKLLLAHMERTQDPQLDAYRKTLGL